jgi:hypothetical protein
MLELSSDTFSRDWVDNRQLHLTIPLAMPSDTQISAPMSSNPLLLDAKRDSLLQISSSDEHDTSNIFFDAAEQHPSTNDALTPKIATLPVTETPELTHGLESQHNTPLQTPRTPRSPPIPGPKPEIYRLVRPSLASPFSEPSREPLLVSQASSPTSARSRASSIWSVGHEGMPGFQPMGMRRNGASHRKDPLPTTFSRRSTMLSEQRKSQSSKARPESLFKILNEAQNASRPPCVESDIQDTDLKAEVSPSCILRTSTPFLSSNFRARTLDGSPAWFCRFDNLVIFDGMRTDERTGETRPNTRSSKGLPVANRNGETVVVCVDVDCGHCREVLGITSTTNTWKYGARVSTRSVCVACKATCQKEWASRLQSDEGSSIQILQSPSRHVYPIGLGISSDLV